MTGDAGLKPLPGARWIELDQNQRKGSPWFKLDTVLGSDSIALILVFQVVRRAPSVIYTFGSFDSFSSSVLLLRRCRDLLELGFFLLLSTRSWGDLPLVKLAHRRTTC